jgi:hypothetical protein
MSSNPAAFGKPTILSLPQELRDIIIEYRTGMRQQNWVAAEDILLRISDYAAPWFLESLVPQLPLWHRTRYWKSSKTYPFNPKPVADSCYWDHWLD